MEKNDLLKKDYNFLCYYYYYPLVHLYIIFLDHMILYSIDYHDQKIVIRLPDKKDHIPFYRNHLNNVKQLHNFLLHYEY